MKRRLVMLTGILLAGACSREYVPEAGASGEQIYQAACRECHAPAANGSIFILSSEHANAGYIAAQVKNGSLLMPAFPKLSSDDLLKISTFALEHSDFVKE